MSRTVVDRQNMFPGCPSIRLSVRHTLMGTTLYSTYIIDRLQLNLDNGRSV